MSFDHVGLGLYVGGCAAAVDFEALAAEGVTAILNVAAELDVPLPERLLNPPERHKVGFEDGWDALDAEILAAVLVLDAVAARHSRVLVHCAGGISRSPAVAACWLAWRRGERIEEAILDVMKSRDAADPCPALVCKATRVLDRLNQMFPRG